MNRVLTVVAMATILAGSSVAVNPLGRFGSFRQPCNYDTSYDFVENGGIWNLQYKPANRDNYAHQCQATYETKGKYFEMHIFYYAMNVMRNDTILFQFVSCGPGCFTGQITLDKCEPINIYLYVLYVTSQYRITFMCTDYETANPEIIQVLIWTRDMVASDRILNEAYSKMEELYQANFDISCPKFDKTVQDDATCDAVKEMEICVCH